MLTLLKYANHLLWQLILLTGMAIFVFFVGAFAMGIYMMAAGIRYDYHLEQWTVRPTIEQQYGYVEPEFPLK